ncbi:hypothetical protein RJT34_04680 [Clitoria ternatea]|uniref:Avr9/Cf-9 rapidly elicited protein n=1 Tax=Clitoria ternatea TaxID=43366 RepID=A0AAN9KN64_CLITE
MEIEAGTAVMTKKVWNIVRVLFLMLRKGIAKSKVMVELHTLLKRGKLAHYYASFSCRSNHLTFISPHHYHYEFSCTNSPAIPFYAPKRNRHHNVLETINNHDSPLPGFGKSPVARQLRVTDSPFPLNYEEGDSQVDVAAEEFIRKFYKDLSLQRKMASLHSPYHNFWDR